MRMGTGVTVNRSHSCRYLLEDQMSIEQLMQLIIDPAKAQCSPVDEESSSLGQVKIKQLKQHFSVVFNMN